MSKYITAHPSNIPECPAIPASGPPCVICKHWKPQPVYRHTDSGYVVDGVRLCHAEEMYSDFSCCTPIHPEARTSETECVALNPKAPWPPSKD